MINFNFIRQNTSNFLSNLNLFHSTVSLLQCFIFAPVQPGAFIALSTEKTTIVLNNVWKSIRLSYWENPIDKASSAARPPLPPPLQWKIISVSGVGLSRPNFPLNSSAESFKHSSSVLAENYFKSFFSLQLFKIWKLTRDVNRSWNFSIINKFVWLTNINQKFFWALFKTFHIFIRHDLWWF